MAQAKFHVHSKQVVNLNISIEINFILITTFEKKNMEEIMFIEM